MGIADMAAGMATGGLSGGLSDSSSSSSSQTVNNSSGFNNSGWTVATSGSKATGSTSWVLIAIVAAVAVVGLVILKKV